MSEGAGAHLCCLNGVSAGFLVPSVIGTGGGAAGDGRRNSGLWVWGAGGARFESVGGGKEKGKKSGNMVRKKVGHEMRTEVRCKSMA